MWGNRNTAPLDASRQIKMCFGIFTGDNQSKHNWDCALVCMKISRQILIIKAPAAPLSRAVNGKNGDVTEML